MSRISKGDVYRQIEGAAQAIKQADRMADGIVSRADIKGAVEENEIIRDHAVAMTTASVFARDMAPLVGEMADTQNALLQVFYRFIDHRDAKPGARVTAKDIDRAVEYAKEKLVAAYDLNNNGLSKAEIGQMKTIGQLSAKLVTLARKMEKMEAEVGARVDGFSQTADAMAKYVTAGDWDAVYSMFDADVRQAQSEMGIGRDQFILEALLAPGSGVTSLDEIKGIAFDFNALQPFGPEGAQLGGKVDLGEGKTADVSVLLSDRAGEPLSFSSAVG